MQKNFPRIIIAATQSGAGKTTITSENLAAKDFTSEIISAVIEKIFAQDGID